MLLFAALAAGIFVYLLLGYITGYVPKSFFTAKPRRAKQVRVSGQAWLHQAGISASPLQFWGSAIGAGAVTFVLVAALSRTWVVALVPAIAVGFLPRVYYGWKRTKANAAKTEAWPDALRSLVSGISASQSLHTALKSLATGGPIPLRPVFARYAALASTLDQRAALEAIKEELSDPLSDRVIEVLIVASEAGPAVVLDILRDLAEASTKDLQLLERLRTAQSEQQLNARAVFVLPFVLLILMTATNSDFRAFYGTPLGILLVLVGTLMLVGGMAFIRRLSRIPAEPRVFTAEATP
ncbi:MAG: type II secretion system F family protein [Acidimicrobiia bacterium]